MTAALLRKFGEEVTQPTKNAKKKRLPTKTLNFSIGKCPL
jgi:hypothetical protein